MRNQIFYENWIFSDDAVGAGDCYLEQALPSNALGYDTLEVTVRCADRRIVNFPSNAKMTWLYRGRQKGSYYVQSITRVGPVKYSISGISAVGRLSTISHPGGVYTGQDAESVILDICGDVPVTVKTVLRGIPLYGWLPYCNPPDKSARDNLSQVLFAIGAALNTDLDGILRVEPLWDGISNTADADHMYQGGEVVYDSPVSSVSVTEHQYIPGGDEETLFEGTAESGHLVTFDAPHSNLTAEGFTVLDSGANWARLSAGSGTLTGQAYIHTTRMLTMTVTDGAQENVKSITDCTLVSLVNSRAVANRMAAYYGCAEHIQAPVLITTHKAGQRISVYNPYDRLMVDGVISSMDITISGVLRGESNILVGYIPPQPEDAEYFDHREVIAQSGEWTAPEGVTEGVAVLIGGAWGGWSGQRGGESESVKNISYSSSGTLASYSYRGYFASQGGVGGAPGAGGSGGKILVANFTVPASGKISVQIGVGGAGGVYSPDASQPGTEGTPTTFGELSSADGSPNAGGYVDTVTGEIFAATGPDGIAGGSGSGGPESPPDHWTIDPDQIFQPGSTVIGPDGQTWTTDRLPVKGSSKDWRAAEAVSSDQSNLLFIEGCFGLSGGAAVGANGLNGALPTRIYASEGSSLTGGGRAGVGGKGADAVAPTKEAGNRGVGGRGGHGGGGAGGSGQLYSITKGSVGTVTLSGQMQSAGPGSGSNGAPGGDGVLILYYRTPNRLGSGHLVTSDKKFFFDRLGRIFVV